MITIKEESKQFAKSPVSLDNFCNRYKTVSGIYTFPSPEFWTLEKNFLYLLKYSEEREFDIKYKMRPDYLSYDEYGTVILAPVLMYINNIFSIEEFDMPTIIIPEFSAIIAVVSDKFPERKISELDEVDM